MTPSTFSFKVRGNELDSFGHVNNAVYLNYFEEARWEMLAKANLLPLFRDEKCLLVVTECHIKYKHELKLHDQATVYTQVSFESPYIIFDQKIMRDAPSCTYARAKVKTLLIDHERTIIGDHPALKALYSTND